MPTDTPPRARHDAALRAAVVATAQALSRGGLTHGTSGNVSARATEGFLITPSALPYETMTAADVVAVRGDGVASGPHRPSSEWRLHHDLYARRPQAGAVVHTHSPYATALSCLRRGIPAFHYMVARGGGVDIRCALYARFGTQALSDAALAALADRRACLLANHGLVALGPDLPAALTLAVEVEALAQQYVLALQAGDPVLLTDAEMADVLAAFRDYRSDPTAP